MEKCCINCKYAITAGADKEAKDRVACSLMLDIYNEGGNSSVSDMLNDYHYTKDSVGIGWAYPHWKPRTKQSDGLYGGAMVNNVVIVENDASCIKFIERI